MLLGCGCRVAPRAGASAGRLTQQTGHGSIRRGGAGARARVGGGGGGGARSLVGTSRPALANILIGDATDPVCESVFRSRGHAVDFKPGLSKVCDGGLVLEKVYLHCHPICTAEPPRFLYKISMIMGCTLQGASVDYRIIQQRQGWFGLRRL